VHIDVYVALAGLIVGMAVGLTGMGGGSLMTPILVLLFGVQPLAAVSSDLVASLIMKPLGALVHVSRRTVRWALVGWLALGSVPAAFLGVLFLRSLGHGAVVQNVVQAALGSVLLLCVAGVLLRAAIERRRQLRVGEAEYAAPVTVRPLPTVAIGAGVGFVLGITSTGSGTLIIVMLLMLYPRLRGSQMVGTDLTQAIPMVGSAALAHILFGDFKLGLTLSIVTGSIPGVLIGSLISSQSSTRFIRTALCVVLLVSGLKLLSVPTLDVGIVLLGAVVLVSFAWLLARAGGRLSPASG
jgi:uncharacterized membrane protein YfcA